MPKITDRPEIVTIAGARWTRSPDDAAVLEAVDSAGPVLLTESTLRQVVRDQEVEAERLKIRRARFEREHAAFLAAPRVTYRGVTWVRADPRDPGALISLDRTVTVRENTLVAMDARDAAEAQRAADEQAARGGR
jgi:hypothetical protein